MKKILFVFVVFFMLITTSCINKEGMDSIVLDKRNITAMELVDKLNINEQTTVNDYKNYSIQITGVIAATARSRIFPVAYDEADEQMFENVPMSSIIIFGNEEELGWEMFFHFNETVDKDLHIGDIITIQGSLENVERYKTLNSKSLRVPMTGEIQYRDVMYIDINDCVIIETNSMRERLLSVEGDKEKK